GEQRGLLRIGAGNGIVGREQFYVGFVDAGVPIAGAGEDDGGRTRRRVHLHALGGTEGLQLAGGEVAAVPGGRFDVDGKEILEFFRETRFRRRRAGSHHHDEGDADEQGVRGGRGAPGVADGAHRGDLRRRAA